MRLRNVPGAREAIAENKFCIDEPTKYKGCWREEIFHNRNPLHVEIGMGKGEFIHTMAVEHPEINFLGVEKYSSVLYRAVEKREQTEIDNLYFLRFDATEIESIFDEGEVDVIYLNFSDPWPKDRHAKRRLTSPEFLERYDKILGGKASTVVSQDIMGQGNMPGILPPGHIQFKTDNRALFDYSVDVINETEIWEIAEITYDLHHSDQLEGNVMTEYETRFASQGHPICRMVMRRNFS